MRVRVLLNIILKNRTCTIALPTKCYKNHCILNILYIFPYMCTYIMYPHSVQFRTFKFPKNPKYDNTEIRSTLIVQTCTSYITYEILRTACIITIILLSIFTDRGFRINNLFKEKEILFLKMALTASSTSFTLRISARVLSLQSCP